MTLVNELHRCFCDFEGASCFAGRKRRLNDTKDALLGDPQNIFLSGPLEAVGCSFSLAFCHEGHLNLSMFFINLLDLANIPVIVIVSGNPVVDINGQSTVKTASDFTEGSYWLQTLLPSGGYCSSTRFLLPLLVRQKHQKRSAAS